MIDFMNKLVGGINIQKQYCLSAPECMIDYIYDALLNYCNVTNKTIKNVTQDVYDTYTQIMDSYTPQYFDIDKVVKLMLDANKNKYIDIDIICYSMNRFNMLKIFDRNYVGIRLFDSTECRKLVLTYNKRLDILYDFRQYLKPINLDKPIDSNGYDVIKKYFRNEHTYNSFVCSIHIYNMSEIMDPSIFNNIISITGDKLFDEFKKIFI